MSSVADPAPVFNPFWDDVLEDDHQMPLEMVHLESRSVSRQRIAMASVAIQCSRGRDGMSCEGSMGNLPSSKPTLSTRAVHSTETVMWFGLMPATTMSRNLEESRT